VAAWIRDGKRKGLPVSSSTMVTRSLLFPTGGEKRERGFGSPLSISFVIIYERLKSKALYIYMHYLYIIQAEVVR
jgi:hypothetical protein